MIVGSVNIGGAALDFFLFFRWKKKLISISNFKTKNINKKYPYSLLGGGPSLQYFYYYFQKTKKKLI